MWRGKSSYVSRGDENRLKQGGAQFLCGRSDSARSAPKGAKRFGGALRKDNSAPAEHYGKALHEEYSAIPERSTKSGALRKK